MKITTNEYKRQQEKIATRLFYKDLQKQKKKLVEFLLKSDQKSFKDDLSTLLDDLLYSLPILISNRSKKVLQRGYNTSKQKFKELTGWFSINWWLKNDEASIYIQNLQDLHLSQRKWSISRTTKLWILEILQEWVDEWLSNSQIAKRISEKDPFIFSKARWELIAVQEIGRAYEYWNYLPMKQLKDKWEIVKKKWITAWDEKVRPEHRKNWEDNWIDLEIPFSWTQSKIAPTWFRCRCSVVYDIQ